MQRLNNNVIINRKVRPTKILQFGGGNFLRAFVDWMVQVLNEETDFNAGVAMVKPTEHGDYHTLKEQDGLFTVILDGINNGMPVQEKRLVSCIDQIINPYTEWEQYLELAQMPSLRFIISNTTEAGIKFNPKDGSKDAPPMEFPAKLTLFLYHRFRYFNGNPDKGCIILPCELIVNNGEALQRTILQYAEHWRLESEFSIWIQTANHFCSSLVDRIVSGYPVDRAQALEAELGYSDPAMVAGEHYHSWVIQAPSLVQKELPFDRTKLNVQFVDDLGPYREMKVRVLNGAHTAMVPVAYLAGMRLVDDAMAHPEINRFVSELLLDETVKTLDFPQEIKERFVADVLDRFKNPLLKHQLMSIALNSTSKFVARLLPTLKDYLALEGKLPKKIVMGLAALLLFYKGEFNGEKIELKDNAEVLSFFREIWEQFDLGKHSLKETVDRILESSAIWGENLNDISGISEMIVIFISSIQEHGVLDSMKYGEEIKKKKLIS